MQVLEVVLLVGACVGHITILAYSNNWWFGLALHHRLLTVIRALHGLLVVAGVTAFAWAYYLDFPLRHFPESGSFMTGVAAGYTALCVLVGFVWLPCISVARHLRPTPAILHNNHTRTVDVAAELGYRPVGR